LNQFGYGKNKKMKFTKTQLTKIYNNCLDLVNTKKPEFFSIRKMKGVMGLCYDDLLEFDYRKDIIPTMFHECIHFIYPKWSETKVLIAEKRLINHISPLQAALFLKEISRKIYKSELINEKDTLKS
jgi:hypothetical protein